MSSEVFTIGRCVRCRKEGGLKNGVCKKCSESEYDEMPDFL